MNKKTLAWCVPQYGPIETAVYKNHMAAIANASRTFDIKFVGVTDKMYLHSACNALVDGALRLNVDYVFWTEADMLLPFDCVTKLYERQKDIVSGLYFLRGCSHMPCLWRHDDDMQKSEYTYAPITMIKENDFFKVHVPGMGCVLYNTDVFRKLEKPWFDLKEEGYGQDMYFYTKVRKAGIEVWVDTSVQCEQLAERKVVGIEDYRKALLDKKVALGFLQGDKKEV